MKVATETLNLSPCCKTSQHRKKDENKKRRNASTIKLEEKGEARENAFEDAVLSR
jgi:hypothetical protein